MTIHNFQTALRDPDVEFLSTKTYGPKHMLPIQEEIMQLNPWTEELSFQRELTAEELEQTLATLLRIPHLHLRRLNVIVRCISHSLIKQL